MLHFNSAAVAVYAKIHGDFGGIGMDGFAETAF